jgi:hypothetical protein
MLELNRPLAGNPILNRMITLDIITPITIPIHTSMVVTIVSTTLIAVIGGNEWLFSINIIT